MRRILVALVLAACADGDETTPPPRELTETTAPDQQNHIVPFPAPTGPTGTSGDTGTKTKPGELFSALQASLHADYPTLVIVTWQQSAPATVHVEYSFDKGVWLEAPEIEGVAGANEQTLVGIPYDVSVSWRLVADKETVAAKNPIATPAPPGSLPLPTLGTTDPKAWADGDNYLLTSVTGATSGILGWGTAGPFYTVILDRQARVVWAHRTLSGHWTLYPQRSVTGDHIILDDFPHPSGSYPNSVAIRTYLDEEIEQIPIPGHHHAFIELPDGTLAWGSRYHGGGEALVEKAPGQKDETVVWTCNDDFSAATRGCISNALYYQAATDTYVYSFYTLEAVVAIDRSKGQTLWYAGLYVDGPDELSFDPSDSQFRWQHGIKLSPQGRLLVSTQNSGRTSSRLYGKEYEVDLDKGMLRQTFSYDGAANAPTNGDIRWLSNGNILHMLGSSGQVREIDSKGNTVWHVDFAQKGETQRLLGTTEWLDDLYELLAPPASKKKKP